VGVGQVFCGAVQFTVMLPVDSGVPVTPPGAAGVPSTPMKEMGLVPAPVPVAVAQKSYSPSLGNVTSTPP